MVTVAPSATSRSLARWIARGAADVDEGQIREVEHHAVTGSADEVLHRRAHRRRAGEIELAAQEQDRVRRRRTSPGTVVGDTPIPAPPSAPLPPELTDSPT
jgi:hypothetical protein